jgi:hypothetical protein
MQIPRCRQGFLGERQFLGKRQEKLQISLPLLSFKSHDTLSKKEREDLYLRIRTEVEEEERKSRDAEARPSTAVVRGDATHAAGGRGVKGDERV